MEEEEEEEGLNIFKLNRSIWLCARKAPDGIIPQMSVLYPHYNPSINHQWRHLAASAGNFAPTAPLQ